nr:hypothetical protein [bacterium]
MKKCFISMKQDTELENGQPLYITRVADIWSPGGIPGPLKKMPLPYPKGEEAFTVSFPQVAQAITFACPELELEVVDGISCKVHIAPPRPKRGLGPTLMVILVCIILFGGAAAAILAFHHDVDMLGIQQGIWEFFTGKKQLLVPWVSIPYCVGLVLGVGLFFLRFGKKIKRKLPNPLDISMYKAQEDIKQYQQSRWESEHDG